MDSNAAERSDALAHRDFRLYLVTRLLVTLAIQMQSVAVGWHIYSLTHRPLDLGLVGLVQFVPAVLLSLVTGDTADRYERRRILMVCYAGICVTALLLLALATLEVTPLPWMFAVLFLLGVARAFAGPAGQALVPDLVPPAQFPQAAAYASSVFQLGMIVGPALGGLAYDTLSAAGAYAACAALMLASTALMAAMRVRTHRRELAGRSWTQLVAGVRYVWREKVLLGAISLDLFAVLLGGAVALLPIFAQEILSTGPWGLGLLRSMPALGATATALFLARRPLRRRTGATMLWSVALFGLATVVFGMSRSLWLSLGALAVLGAADMFSVVIRHTLVQLETPPEMRGRVSAVNLVFIGASNELGEFESGVTAEWFGPVRAVVLGGLGTCLVVALWAWAFPGLRQLDRLGRGGAAVAGA